MADPPSVRREVRADIDEPRREGLLDEIVRRHDRGNEPRWRMSAQQLVASIALVCVTGLGTFAIVGAPHWSMSLEQAQEYAFYNQKQSGDCVIKGNISVGGERIYHVPGGKFYNRTRINPLLGERWFCSEADARAAGFRRSYR